MEDKLSVIAKNSSPNASPVQLLVGAKHLEDKLSVIAKNSSPNASPVQLSVNQKEEEDYPIVNYLFSLHLHIKPGKISTIEHQKRSNEW